MKYLTKEEHNYVYYNEKIEIDGVTFSLVDEDDLIDDNGKSISYYLADDEGNHIGVNIYLDRYGYEDYGYDSYNQDLKVYEVERKEIVITKWVTK